MRKGEQSWLSVIRSQLNNRAGIFGLTLCLVWIFIASHDLSISISIFSIVGLSARAVLLIGTTLGAAFLLLFMRNRTFDHTFLLVLSVAFMSIGFLLTILPASLEAPEVLCIACIGLAGFGSGILFLAWMSKLQCEKPEAALAYCGLAILAAALINALSLMLPYHLLIVLMMILPAISLFLFFRTRTPEVDEPSTLRLELTPPKLPSPKRAAFIAVMLPLIVEGFAYGAFTQMVFNFNASLENVIGIFALAMTALMLLISVSLYPRLLKGRLFCLPFLFCWL